MAGRMPRHLAVVVNITLAYAQPLLGANWGLIYYGTLAGSLDRCDELNRATGHTWMRHCIGCLPNPRQTAVSFQPLFC